jgi:hypothetical protein
VKPNNVATRVLLVIVIMAVTLVSGIGYVQASSTGPTNSSNKVIIDCGQKPKPKPQPKHHKPPQHKPCPTPKPTSTPTITPG